MAHDVFISYSSKDKQTADAVCAVLERKTIRCWIAPRDIQPGGDWAESIIEAIRPSRVMVLVFSRHANESVQIKREVERAIHNGIPVIPVRIENIAPTGALEYSISSAHWLDAFTPPMERHLNYLADVVRAILDEKPKPVERLLPRSMLPSWSKYAIGAAAVLLLLLCLAWHKMFPPTVGGDWTLAQCSLTPGPVACEMITKPLSGDSLKGELHVKGLNTYSADFTATDSGTVAIEKKPFINGLEDTYRFTFTSNTTHQPIVLTTTRQPKLTIVTGNAGLYLFGVPNGDERLDLLDSQNGFQLTIHKKPSADEIASQMFDSSMVGDWSGTPFNIYPQTNLWSGTLEIHADQTYLLTITRSESGILDANNGAWSAKPAASGNANPMSAFAPVEGLFVSGHYALSGSNALQIVSESGSFTFNRK